jgi:hypothetical protein
MNIDKMQDLPVIVSIQRKLGTVGHSFSWGMMLCLGAAIPAESVVDMVGFGPAEDGLDSSSVTLL